MKLASWRRPEPVLTDIPDTAWAYLAGIIDGEGCIRAASSRPRPDALYYHPRIMVTQRIPDVLMWIEGQFPGVGHHKSWVRRGSNRAYRRWIVSSANEVKFILEGCMPFLVLKQRQARLTLELAGRPHEDRQAELALTIHKLKELP